MIWPHASKKNPCPICGSDNWCSFGEKSVLCRRAESDRPHYDRGGSLDGWYHFDGDARPKIITSSFKNPHVTEKPSEQFNLSAFLFAQKNTTGESIYRLATNLNVSVESLLELGACWTYKHSAFAFPMRDGNGAIVGARLRNSSGLKWSWPGSNGSAIFLPIVSAADIFELKYNDTLFLPEGPTDTAAFRSIGLLAWGRPNCNSGTEQILSLMKQHQWMQYIRRVVVVSDNDEIKTRPDGSEWRPGYDGALRLASAIRLPHTVWMTPSPHKDIRQFVKAGASADLIMNMVNKKVWTR